MEDPKRIRTKLRLDLKDVRRQIEDLEDLLKKDQSPENVEAHRKLVEYEKKLKDQYEKMTGLSVDQASNLTEKGRIADKKRKKAPFSGFLAFIGAVLIGYGFYNTVLHSITGFAPTDLLDYFTGQGSSVSGLNVFVASLLYETSFYLVVIPLGAGAVLFFLSGLLDGSRNRLLAIIESLGILATAGAFAYILYTSEDVQTGQQVITDNLLYFSGAVLAAGLFIIIGSLGHKSLFRKFLGIISAILFIYSGVQYYLLVGETDAGLTLVQQWPYITVPLIIAIYIQAFIGFLRMIK